MGVGACLPSLSRLSHAPTPIQKVLLPAFLYNFLVTQFPLFPLHAARKRRYKEGYIAQRAELPLAGELVHLKALTQEIHAHR